MRISQPNLRILAAMIGFILSIVLFAPSSMAAEISLDLAKQVARNFLSHIRSTHSLVAVEPVEKSGQRVAYLAALSPGGYILIAGDTIRVPVKGYSLASSFSDLPDAYVQILLGELEVPKTTLRNAQPEITNAPFWQFLTQNAARQIRDSLNYTPDTFLLTTRWDQGYPYNKFNPTIDGEPTLTGCVQTALAQLMRYHSHPEAGSGVFSHTWNGQTLTAVMNRPFNWDAMPDVSNGSTAGYAQDEVAALMRDLGILNQAYFGLSGTSTSFHAQDFGRAFGYGPVSSMSSSDPDFFAAIRNEIDNLRPVLLSMPNHMTVADGYASDGTGKKIHVNLGWSGAEDDYYYLDQTNVIGYYTFPADHTIYYNIRPCQGGECDPYDAAGGGNPPVIASTLDDMTIDAAATIRIEAYDPDGDPVTLSAQSSCTELQTVMNANLLTLTPQISDILCRITVNAQSHDGSAAGTFDVLSLDEMIYLGTGYDIGGQFADQSEVDEFTVYLEGDITISGDRGYSNQAFYIWLKDQNGNTVITAGDEPITGNLTAGLYTVSASLKNIFTHYYYYYNADTSSYILSVDDDDLTYTVANLAADLGISLSNARPEVEAFVTRFYQLCLERTPDQTGLNYWVEGLFDGSKTGADIASGFVFSQEFTQRDTTNQEFLTILYEAFFDRDPDSGGYQYWLDQLTNGVSRADVLDGFVFALEFKNLCSDYGITPTPVAAFVRRFYQQCLSRNPDSSGLDYWVNSLVDGSKTGADVARGFVLSAEFVNRNTTDPEFLTILYTAFFNRDPDDSGFNSWLTMINGGASREDVLNGFIYAQEFDNLCAEYDIMPN